jgi:hypothetical protein
VTNIQIFQIANGIKSGLERTYISYLCLLLAIIIKLALFLHFFQLEGDKLFQVIGAKNLIEGNGLTVNYVHLEDLSRQVYEPLNRWPPGYSLLVAAFLTLSNNTVISCLIVDMFSIVLFFLVISKLLKTLTFPPFLRNILILFLGAAFGPYLSKPTDLLANATLLFSCYLAIIFAFESSKSMGFAVLLGIANVFPLFLRYMYFPCVFIIPIVLIGLGYLRKDGRLRKGGFVSLIVTIVFSGCILAFQRLYTGHASYIFLSGKGFFPENVLMLYPAAIDAFVDVNFLQQQVARRTGVNYMFWWSYAKIINGIILVFLLLKFLHLVKFRKYDFFTKWFLFISVAAITNIVILITLVYLSVTNHSSSHYFTDRLQWTFVGEGRFFIFLMTVLPLIAAYSLFNKSMSKLYRWKKALQFVFIGLIFCQLSHTVYFLAKRFDPLGLKGGNVLITLPVKKYLIERIIDLDAYPIDIVMTSHDETVSNWATLNGKKGLLHIDELKTSTINIKKGYAVFALIKKEMLPTYQAILKDRHFVMEKQIGQLYIFSNFFHLQ